MNCKAETSDWKHVFETGMASDLGQLMSYPEISENVSFLFTAKSTEFPGSDKSNKMLSAHKNNLCSQPPPNTPVMPVSALFAAAKGSKSTVKSRGLRGSSCLEPLVRLKKGEVRPLGKTDALGDELITLI